MVYESFEQVRLRDGDPDVAGKGVARADAHRGAVHRRDHRLRIVRRRVSIGMYSVRKTLPMSSASACPRLPGPTR